MYVARPVPPNGGLIPYPGWSNISEFGNFLPEKNKKPGRGLFQNQITSGLVFYKTKIDRTI